MTIRILEEANRCLQCPSEPCHKACPISTPIPQMIKYLREGSIDEAGQMLYENNPLSVICSMICPVERQCEGHCVFNKKGMPVAIQSIENYISNFYIANHTSKIQNLYEGRIAVVGGGPAGIAMSIFMARYGYDVTIYESMPRIGGVMRYGIPEFRLPERVLDSIEERVRDLGISIKPNITVGPMMTMDELRRDGFDAIFIGTGVWNPKKIDIKGETLPNVLHAVNFLKRPQVYDLGNDCIVIGAGNVAMDVARTARRSGVENVSIYYRRSREDIRATDEEYQYTVLDGVDFTYHVQPVEFTEDGLYVEHTAGDMEGQVEFVKCDSIVIAISQATQRNLALSDDELKLNDYGLIITDDKGMTTKDGVFATGDVVTGAKTVVEAVRGAKEVANSIHEYLELKKDPDQEVTPLYEI